MSGSAGIRGYLVQTLICLLEGLRPDAVWDSVSIEPSGASEKVDILWTAAGGARAQQVKSSQNQIARPDVEAWAASLQGSLSADTYELILLGPSSQAVVSIGAVGKVSVPPPKVLDLLGLVEQAAQRLDRYLESRGISAVPAFARELIVHGLITKLELYSTSGASISRADLDKLINEWILILYPQSVKAAVEMQCDVLTDTVIFAGGLPGPAGPAQDNFAILMPLQVINGGQRTTVIDWIALKVVASDHAKLYQPILFVDLRKFIVRAPPAEYIVGQFSTFAVLPDTVQSMTILFTQPRDDARYAFRPWSAAGYAIQLYVKYRDREFATLQSEIQSKLSAESIALLNAGNSISDSARKITI